ncbi:hypothetical protein [uncultured Bacteroides sp.]|uniref:hypothetical protein n=1 Tax=uncultured Bacteroides sp. TaxID=162156 RepID=UPI002AA66808|nr:hypothetical protein [uncultured Bacteroides sp.]
MEQKIKHISKKLSLQYLLFWLFPVLLTIAYECNWLDVGLYATDVRMQYYLETLGILLTVGCVPLSLKLFSFVLKKGISEVSFATALRQYFWWSAVRLCLLEIAVLACIVIYYLTLDNIGGLCALIALTASVFCLPGEKRLREELNL